jgi:hypothetical protein
MIHRLLTAPKPMASRSLARKLLGERRDVPLAPKWIARIARNEIRRTLVCRLKKN